MNTIFKIVTALAFIAASAWIYFDLKFDSIFAFFISLAAVIALFIVPKMQKKSPNLSQSISNQSKGIQAGRDVNIKK